MKATSLFGGVQVFNIILSIIRSKFIAILLGPTGMGIMGLLTSTTGLIGNLTNFGLSTSAVKDIAAANNTKNTQRIATIITVFRRLVWITGALGMVATLILAPWLSQLTFGNKNYTLAFIWISITLLFQQLSSGQLVILQGMRKLQFLAKANIVGSSLGLLATLPLYYFWKIDGIVPGLIGTALLSLLISWYFSRKVKVKSTTTSYSQTYFEGKSMLQMGFMISLSGLLTAGASYIIRIFIGRAGGVEQVGLYTAGFAIINTYVGLIFNAMGTDYYPRLSAAAYDNKLCKRTINQQAEIALLILAPILIMFLVFIKWVIILLYSKQFIAISDMIYWMAIGMFFKATTWTLGFLILAKGNGKVFFWSELASNVLTLLLNIFGYWIWGLTGLGISFFVAYIIALCQVFFINKIKFEFSFDQSFLTIFSFQFGLAIAGFLTMHYLKRPFAYMTGALLICVSIWYSLIELNKRLGLLSLARNFWNK
jgi:O-antigen/teichoic acid export membrane protein